MRRARGMPAHYAGGWDARKSYDAGAVVHHKQDWFVSKTDDNEFRPAEGSRAWAYLGSMGAIPTQVAHKWNPKVLQYPTTDVSLDDPNQEMSEPVDVCSDCWKDADLKNAFDARAHLYVIREPEVALGL